MQESSKVAVQRGRQFEIMREYPPISADIGAQDWIDSHENEWCHCARTTRLTTVFLEKLQICALFTGVFAC